MMKSGLLDFIFKTALFCVTCCIFGSTGAKGDSREKSKPAAPPAADQKKQTAAAPSSAGVSESVPTHDLGPAPGPPNRAL